MSRFAPAHTPLHAPGIGAPPLRRGILYTQRSRPAGEPRTMRPLQAFDNSAPALRGGACSLLLAFVAAGCATQAGPEDSGSATQTEAVEPLVLAAPARGFQIESLGTRIEPGEDIRWC